MCRWVVPDGRAFSAECGKEPAHELPLHPAIHGRDNLERVFSGLLQHRRHGQTLFPARFKGVAGGLGAGAIKTG